jgi:hypothetical protein
MKEFKLHFKGKKRDNPTPIPGISAMSYYVKRDSCTPNPDGRDYPQLQRSRIEDQSSKPTRQQELEAASLLNLLESSQSPEERVSLQRVLREASTELRILLKTVLTKDILLISDTINRITAMIRSGKLIDWTGCTALETKAFESVKKEALLGTVPNQEWNKKEDLEQKGADLITQEDKAAARQFAERLSALMKQVRIDIPGKTDVPEILTFLKSNRIDMKLRTKGEGFEDSKLALEIQDSLQHIRIVRNQEGEIVAHILLETISGSQLQSYLQRNDNELYVQLSSKGIELLERVKSGKIKKATHARKASIAENIDSSALLFMALVELYETAFVRGSDTIFFSTIDDSADERSLEAVALRNRVGTTQQQGSELWHYKELGNTPIVATLRTDKVWERLVEKFPERNLSLKEYLYQYKVLETQIHKEALRTKVTGGKNAVDIPKPTEGATAQTTIPAQEVKPASELSTLEFDSFRTTREAAIFAKKMIRHNRAEIPKTEDVEGIFNFIVGNARENSGGGATGLSKAHMKLLDVDEISNSLDWRRVIKKESGEIKGHMHGVFLDKQGIIDFLAGIQSEKQYVGLLRKGRSRVKTAIFISRVISDGLNELEMVGMLFPILYKAFLSGAQTLLGKFRTYPMNEPAKKVFTEGRRAGTKEELGFVMSKKECFNIFEDKVYRKIVDEVSESGGIPQEMSFAEFMVRYIELEKQFNWEFKSKKRTARTSGKTS